MFKVRQHPLLEDGVIPGARGHKKVVVPKGTLVWVIQAGDKYFWCAYQKEETAQMVAKSLEEGTKPTAKRHISYDAMIAWNFRYRFPTRICREK